MTIVITISFTIWLILPIIYSVWFYPKKGSDNLLLVNVKLFTVNSKSLYLSKILLRTLVIIDCPYPYEGYKSHHLALFVSELKTPLHLIAGYSEMLTNDLVSSQDVQQFSEKNYIESQRMIQLVEDIINLSHLDESSQVRMESVDLYQVAKMYWTPSHPKRSKRKSL